MNTTFPVNWQRLFKSLTIFISLAIDVSLILFIVIRFISMGFDYSKTFGHASLFGFMPFIIVYIPLCSGIMAFLISQFLRIAVITLSDDKITGRNYWGLKNTIPLSDITAHSFRRQEWNQCDCSKQQISWKGIHHGAYGASQ